MSKGKYTDTFKYSATRRKRILIAISGFVRLNGLPLLGAVLGGLLVPDVVELPNAAVFVGVVAGFVASSALKNLSWTAWLPIAPSRMICKAIAPLVFCVVVGSVVGFAVKDLVWSPWYYAFAGAVGVTVGCVTIFVVFSVGRWRRILFILAGVLVLWLLLTPVPGLLDALKQMTESEELSELNFEPISEPISDFGMFLDHRMPASALSALVAFLAASGAMLGIVMLFARQLVASAALKQRVDGDFS